MGASFFFIRQLKLYQLVRTQILFGQELWRLPINLGPDFWHIPGRKVMWQLPKDQSSDMTTLTRPEEEIAYGLVDQPGFFDVVTHTTFYFALIRDKASHIGD